MLITAQISISTIQSVACVTRLSGAGDTLCDREERVSGRCVEAIFHRPQQTRGPASGRRDW